MKQTQSKKTKELANVELVKNFTRQLVPDSLFVPRPTVERVEYLSSEELKFSITPQGISKLTPELFALPPIKLSLPKWHEEPTKLFRSNSIARHTSFHLETQITSDRSDLPWRLVEFRSGTAYLNLIFIRNRPKLLKEFSVVTDYFLERHVHCVTLTSNFANFCLKLTPEDRFEITYGIKNYTSRSAEIPKTRTILIQHFHMDSLVEEYTQYFDLNRTWDPKESERPWQKTTFVPSQRP